MKTVILLCGVVGWLGLISGARGVVLYDGSLGTAPDAQPWLTYDGLGLGITHATAGSVTTLNTAALAGNYAGYSNDYPTTVVKNSAFPTLDPAAGFDLTFSVKIDGETHTSTDRAGFSVILLGSDHKGVELGFWTDEVFAQNTGFTHGQTATLDTTTGHSYDLHVGGGSFTLSADGTPLLADAVRDHSAFTPPAGLPNPYALPNYVFFGDDTTSGSATVEFSAAAVTVPEPTCLLGLLAAPTLLRRRRSAELPKLTI